MSETRCYACGNILHIVVGKCKMCGTIESEAKNGPKIVENQVSGMSDELSMRCPHCNSSDIHFCYNNMSLRCKTCTKLLSYDEAVAWQQT